MHSHEAISLLINKFDADLLPQEMFQNIMRFSDQKMRNNFHLVNKDCYVDWLNYELQTVNVESFEQKKLSTGAFLVCRFLTHVMRDIVFRCFDYPIPQHIIKAIKKDDPGCSNRVRYLYSNTIRRLVGDKPLKDGLGRRFFDVQLYVQTRKKDFIPFAQKRFFKHGKEKAEAVEKNIGNMSRNQLAHYILFELYRNDAKCDPNCGFAFASWQENPMAAFFYTALLYQRDYEKIYNFFYRLFDYGQCSGPLNLDFFKFGIKVLADKGEFSSICVIAKLIAQHNNQRDLEIRLIIETLKDAEDFVGLIMFSEELIAQHNNGHDFSAEIGLIINSYKKMSFLPLKFVYKVEFFLNMIMKSDIGFSKINLIVHFLKSTMIFCGGIMLFADLFVYFILKSSGKDCELLCLTDAKNVCSWLSKQFLLISNKSL